MPSGSALRVDKIIISRNENVIRLLLQEGKLGNGHLNRVITGKVLHHLGG